MFTVYFPLSRISRLLHRTARTCVLLFRTRIHLLSQFLARLNSNFLPIVTRDRAKRSGTFAGVLLQTNIFLLACPACRSSLPRAETWNVTYSNTSLGAHASRPIETRDAWAYDTRKREAESLYCEDIITRNLLLYISCTYPTNTDCFRILTTTLILYLFPNYYL